MLLGMQQAQAWNPLDLRKLKETKQCVQGEGGADLRWANLEDANLKGVDFSVKKYMHEATSRFFEKGLNVMEVATITGHKDLRMLQRYTHLRAEDLAKKLG